MNVREELFKNSDEKYKKFQSGLMPGIDPQSIIGVRIPILRKIAKRAAKENAFVDCRYFEEKAVRGMMIGYSSVPLEEKMKRLCDFVPLIDNWAVCDTVCSTLKFAADNRETVWNFIVPYLTKSEYEVRFAVVMMLNYFLCDEYIDKVFDALANLKSGRYYADMAAAWTVSKAFLKYPQKTLRLIDSRRLSPWIHNKSIQKIRESYAVDKKTKEMLKTKKV